MNLETSPDIKVSRSFKDYYELLNKRIKYLQDILFNFKSKKLAVISKDRGFFQYKSRDIIYIIPPWQVSYAQHHLKLLLNMYFLWHSPLPVN